MTSTLAQLTLGATSSSHHPTCRNFTSNMALCEAACRYAGSEFGSGMNEHGHSTKLELDLGLDFDARFFLDDLDHALDTDTDADAEATPLATPIVTPVSPVASMPAKTLNRSASSTSLNAKPRTLNHSPSLPSLTASRSALGPSPAVKSVLVAPSTTSAPGPSTNVTFTLPPHPNAGRLPRLPEAVQGSRRPRRVQVGAFGEISWVAEPERRGQADASKQGTRRRDGNPRNTGSNKVDDSKDWLIAHHVQQLHARDRERQKKDVERAKRTLAPSPLSREAPRSSLPSITEEATCPPRTTSLHAMQSRPMVPPAPRRASSDPHAPPTATIRGVPIIDTGRGPRRPDMFSAPAPTSPLARSPINRAPSPPPMPIRNTMPATTVKDAENCTPPLRRHTSLLNLTLRRATKPLKLDFGFGRHARSDSQSSKGSRMSQTSEYSEDSVETMETDERELAGMRTPSASTASLASAGSVPESFQTCLTAPSADTLTLRTPSPSPSEDQPQTPSNGMTPRSTTPTTPHRPHTPGSPESDVLATPDAHLCSWSLKGEEQRIERLATRNLGVPF